MLKRLIREKLTNWLDNPRPRATLAKALLSGRRSLDPLTTAISTPGYDFARDHSLYPSLAAEFTKIPRVDTHPHYAWGVLQGVVLAKAIGLERVSVIEFGVAGGRGLIALETIAAALEERYGTGIDVFGFDGVGGLPPVADNRDLPNLWSGGFYPMDREKLKGQLRKARVETRHRRLIEAQIGNVPLPRFPRLRPARLPILWAAQSPHEHVHDSRQCRSAASPSRESKAGIRREDSLCLKFLMCNHRLHKPLSANRKPC